jgi:ornithine cyclodeaminase
MRIVDESRIRSAIGAAAAIDAMREAVIAYSRGELDTPMPMHLDLSSGGGGEVHIKSSYRRGGERYALKVAGTYATRPYGSIVLVSVATGETLAYFDDGGFLTDLRTAAVSALAARELGRTDEALAILGTGVQARLQASLHAEVLRLREVRIWGRDRAKADRCARDVAASLPGASVTVAGSPAEAAASARLIVTATASRAPLLSAADLRPGTHVSAVGADSPGKQELDPEILRRATLLLVDSKAQCERLGELQHAKSEIVRAIELGRFCERPAPYDRSGITVADFTGLGAEDLYIAEACLRGLTA